MSQKSVVDVLTNVNKRLQAGGGGLRLGQRGNKLVRVEYYFSPFFVV